MEQCLSQLGEVAREIYIENIIPPTGVHFYVKNDGVRAKADKVLLEIWKEKLVKSKSKSGGGGQH